LRKARKIQENAVSVGRYFLIVASLLTLLAIANTQSRMVQCLVKDD